MVEDIILKKHNIDIIKGSFADGLKTLSIRGELCRKDIILTKTSKNIITTIINECKERTYDIEDEEIFNLTMESFQFIENLLKDKRTRNKPIEKRIARFTYYWISDQKYHHLISDIGEEKVNYALQWLLNKINSQYAVFELLDRN